MKHKYIVAGITAMLCIVLIGLCVLLATPVNAYEGERITTARQDALHEAADMLRAAGLADDDPAIMALSDIWDNEEQGPVRYWMPLPQPPKEET